MIVINAFRFDSETQNLMNDLRQEKAQRERLAREKEIAIAEKFTVEQNLSVSIFFFLLSPFFSFSQLQIDECDIAYICIYYHFYNRMQD